MKTQESKAFPKKEMTDFAKDINKGNRDKGFWDSFEQACHLKETSPNDFTESIVNSNINEKLLLVITEVSEACEAIRKGSVFKGKFINEMSEEQEKERIGEFTGESFVKEFENNVKDTFEDEIADSVIRLFDLAGGLGIDIGWHVEQKLKYNATRSRKHGKKF